MNKTSHVKSNKKGFTLVELLIAMAVTGIVAGAIFTAFQSQQKSYLIQDQVTEMQQNLRAAMDIMVRKISMAGYGYGDKDPKKKYFRIVNSHDVSALGMTPNGRDTNGIQIALMMDISKDGVPQDNNSEQVAYRLNNNIIQRYDTGAVHWQPVAENIEALGFAYAFDGVDATNPHGDGILDTYNVGGNEQVIWAVDTDGDGNWDNLDTDGDGDIDADDGPGIGNNGVINGIGTGTAVDTSQIRAVRIWILARVKRPDPDFVNTNTYIVGANVITPNDGFRRRLLSTTVKCRNMGP